MPVCQINSMNMKDNNRKSKTLDIFFKSNKTSCQTIIMVFLFEHSSLLVVFSTLPRIRKKKGTRLFEEDYFNHNHLLTTEIHIRNIHMMSKQHKFTKQLVN
jgi:hypothetical protein